MLEFMQKGGIIMWPISACALVAMAIILERMLYFIITGIRYDTFRDLLLQRLNGGGFKTVGILDNPFSTEKSGFLRKLKARLRQEQWKRSPYYKIAGTYLENIYSGTRSREEALKRTGSEEIEKMERYFKGLSAISHASPLLGLLGTVTGIIAAFGVISRLGGQVDVTALAGGIWEAMLTTAAGLVVAIPAQLFYLYYEKIVSERASRMSYLITYLNERLFRNSRDLCDDDSDREPGRAEDIIPPVPRTGEIISDEV
jgi:biopolymer transport protein ExbB